MASFRGINPDKIYTDPAKTFDKMYFQRVLYDTQGENEFGETTDEVGSTHVELLSMGQDGAISVNVHGELTEDLKFGDEVEFVNPVYSTFSSPKERNNINTDFNEGFAVTIDALRKVNGQGQTKSNRPVQPQQNPSKSDK